MYYAIVGLRCLHNCYCGTSIPVQLLLWGYSCTTAIVGLQCRYNYYCGATVPVQLLLWGYSTCATAIVGLQYLCNCYCGATVRVHGTGPQNSMVQVLKAHSSSFTSSSSPSSSSTTTTTTTTLLKVHINATQDFSYTIFGGVLIVIKI